MDLGQWEQLAGWIRSVWPHPGYDDAQVRATYFLVHDLDVDDAQAALRDSALTEGIAETPHPSEVRRTTTRWLRTRRKPAPVALTGSTAGDDRPADDEFVRGLVRDLRRGLTPAARTRDPLRVGDGSVITAGRARVRRLRSPSRAAARPDGPI